MWKTAHLDKLQGSVPLKFLQVCQFCNLDIVSSTLTITPLCEWWRYKLFSSPKMSFLMLLQIPLKYLQLCKNSPTIFSGTYKSLICCVKNMDGSWNRLWKLTLRLRGRQGRCVLFAVYNCSATDTDHAQQHSVSIKW